MEHKYRLNGLLGIPAGYVDINDKGIYIKMSDSGIQVNFERIKNIDFSDRKK